MPKYDEEAIADAKAKWREQDLRTWRKRDKASVAERKRALQDLLCAHMPIEPEEGQAMQVDIDTLTEERDALALEVSRLRAVVGAADTLAQACLTQKNSPSGLYARVSCALDNYRDTREDTQ